MYTKLDNPNFFLYEHKVPVWRIKDTTNDWRNSSIANSPEEAHTKLIEMIRRDYASKMNRENRQKEEKVWYKP